MAVDISPNVDPVKLAETLYDIRLWETQAEILRALETNRRVAVRGANAVGKTTVLAVAALNFAIRHERARVLIVGPGWTNVRAVIWAEIHSLLARSQWRLPADSINQTEIRLNSGNLIIGLSTNEPGRLHGHHSERMLVLVDEAPAIEETFWPPLEAALAGGEARILIAGNPLSPIGYFHECFTRKRANWKLFNVSAFSSPNLSGLDVDALLKLSDEQLDLNVAPYLVTRRWCRERYDEWFNGSAENSPLWQSRVLGEFPSSATTALVPLHLLEAATAAAVDDGKSPLDVGVDPAGAGKDMTAVCAISNGNILALECYPDAQPEGRVIEFCRRWRDRIRIVRYDSAGIGGFFGNDLRRAGFPTAGVNVAQKAKDPEKYANQKAERYFALRQCFQEHQVRGLPDDCLAELSAMSYSVDSSGRLIIEDKATVKSLIGHSPDKSEALMLAMGERHVPIEYTPVKITPYRRYSVPGDVPSSCSAFYQDARLLDERSPYMTGEDWSAEQDAPSSMLTKSRRFGGRGAW